LGIDEECILYMILSIAFSAFHDVVNITINPPPGRSRRIDKYRILIGYSREHRYKTSFN
jgi:hypothetical protein